MEKSKIIWLLWLFIIGFGAVVFWHYSRKQE